MAAFVGFLRKAPPLGTVQLRHPPELSHKLEATLCGSGASTQRFCRNDAPELLTGRREITRAVLIRRNGAEPPTSPQSPRLNELILGDDRSVQQVNETSPLAAPRTARHRKVQEMDGIVLGWLRACQRLGHDHD